MLSWHKFLLCMIVMCACVLNRSEQQDTNATASKIIDSRSESMKKDGILQMTPLAFGSCMCDMTFSFCDPNCVCDPDCSRSDYNVCVL